MAVDIPVTPGQWVNVAGLWVRLQPDPLAGPRNYFVTAHRDGAGNFWFDLSRPVGGLRLQTLPPLPDTDGGPL